MAKTYPRFKEAGIDTATYSQQIAELKSKVDMFAIEVDSLKLVVDDLVNMDCATDPEGFVVSLREAKILRQNVLQKSQNFRQYLSASIRPTLTKIRSELLSKPHSTNKEFNRL